MREYSAGIRRLIIPFFASRVMHGDGIENIPQQAPCILAANHSVPFDHATLAAYLSSRLKGIIFFPAKKKYDTFYRRLGVADRLGMVPVEPQAPNQCLDRLVELLKEGHTIGIFPEGEGNGGVTLLRGKTGVARLALWSGVPVVPVGMDGPQYGKHHIIEWMRLPFQKHRTVTIRCGKPLYFSARGREITRALLHEITDTIMREVAQLCGKKYPY